MNWFDASIVRTFRTRWKSFRMSRRLAPSFEDADEIARGLVVGSANNRHPAALDWTHDLRLLGGMPLEVGVSDHIQTSLNEIFVDQVYTGNGFYRPKPKDCVVDLGAHIGLFSIYLLGIEPNLKIFAVEPGQDNFRRLKKHLESISNADSVETHAVAIGGRDEVRELLKTRSTQLRSLFFRAEVVDRSHEYVAVVSLENFLKQVLKKVERVDLLKMDIEGAEWDALRSLTDETLDCVKAIAMEVHEGIRPDTLEPVIQKLKDAGFLNIETRLMPGVRKTTLVRAKRWDQ